MSVRPSNLVTRNTNLFVSSARNIKRNFFPPSPTDGLESGTAPDPRTKRAQSNVRSDGERRRGDWERDIRYGMLEIDERIFLRGTNIPWTGSNSRLRRMGDLAVSFAHQGLQSLSSEEGFRSYHGRLRSSGGAVSFIILPLHFRKNLGKDIT